MQKVEPKPKSPTAHVESPEPDDDAVFRALCQIQALGTPGDPHQRLQRFVAQLGAEAPHGANDVDDLPDFSAEVSEAHEKQRPAEADVSEQARVMAALLKTLQSYDGLLERYNRDFDQVFARRAAGESDTDDDTIQRLRAAQLILVKYPVASQAAFAALVREGRRFAKTEEGQALKRKLGRSAVFAKARTMFEGLANGMLSENKGPLPSTYVDAFVQALDRDLEQVLAETAGLETKR